MKRIAIVIWIGIIALWLAGPAYAGAAPTVVAELSWVPPDQNTDNTTITNLAGYRIYWGTSPTALTNVIQVPGANVRTYRLTVPAGSIIYIALTAYNTTANESVMSVVRTKDGRIASDVGGVRVSPARPGPR